MAQKRKQTRSTSRLLALEPRLLFDGAAMVAAQEATQPDDAHATEQQSNDARTTEHDSSTQKQLDFDGSFASVSAVNVVVIDSRVPQLDELVADLEAGGAQVHVVQANESGLTAISNALAQAQNADGLHIISHGSSGSITLGTDTINSNTLQANGAQVQDWAYYLTQDADILLYGCDVAAGEQGQAFIQELAYLSGADIAASTNATGAAALGGDWTLEKQTGDIEAKLALSKAAAAQYAETLADAAPTPEVSIGSAQQTLPGASTTVTITFDNTGTAPGYGPYVDLFVPRKGADGSTTDLTKQDGISFGNATYSGTTVESQTYILTTGNETQIDGKATIKITNGQITHPVTKEVINIPAGFGAGDELVVLTLPFGSFTADQPAVTLDVTLNVSDKADPGTLQIAAVSGFMFGKDALDNPATDAPLRSTTAAVQTIAIDPYTISASITAPEGETATGSNYVHDIVISITAAKDTTISGSAELSLQMPDGIVLTNIDALRASLAAQGWEISQLPQYDSSTGNDVLVLKRVEGKPITGTGQPVTFNVSFYVAETFQTGNAVLNAADGASTLISFAPDAVTLKDAKWQGIAGSALSGLIKDEQAVSAAITAGSITAKSIAVIKGSNAPEAGIKPGDSVDFNLKLDVSDYFRTGDIYIQDTIADGLTFDVNKRPTMNVSWKDANGVTHTETITFDPEHILVRQDDGSWAPWNGTDPLNTLDNGSTEIRFNVSQQLTAKYGAAAAQMVGGFVNTSDGSTLANGSGATTATVTYSTKVEEDYRSSDSVTTGSQNNNLKLRDELTGGATASADILNRGNGEVSSENREDGSTASVSVVGSEVKLEIATYTRDGQTYTYTKDTILTAGDQVTYKLVYDLPIKDYENLVLDAYLPMPVFDLKGTGTKFEFAADSTIGGTLTSSVGDGNHVRFDLGDSTPIPSNGSGKVAILITVTVTDTPMADKLYLTTQGQSRDDSSTATGTTTSSITQVVIGSPDVVINKGYTNKSDTQTGVTDQTFTPGNALTSSNVAGIGASNASKFDGGDKVTVTIAVENKGSSPKGAFDVGISDEVDTNLDPNKGSLKFYSGSGTLITSVEIFKNGAWTSVTVAGNEAEVFDALQSANGIRFADSSASGALAQGQSIDQATGKYVANSTGSNIIYVTYEATVKTDHKPGDTSSSSATLSNFSNKEAGQNILASPSTDTASIGFNSNKIDLIITSTPDHSDTIVATDGKTANAVVGEYVDYQLTINVSEATTKTAEVVVELGTGLGLVSVGGKTSAGDIDATTNGFGNSGSYINGHAIMANGEVVNITLTSIGNGKFTVSLGDLINAQNDDDNETITFNFRAVVLNTATNKSGASGDPLKVTATLTGADSSEPERSATVTVQEPKLTATLTADQSTVTADNTVTYTLTVSNNSGYAAHDVQIRELLELIELKYLGDLTLLGSATTTGAGTVSGPGITANEIAYDISILESGKSFTVKFTAKVEPNTPFGQTLTIDPTITWTSLPGDGADRAAIGNTTTDSERTGDGTGNNNYTITREAKITFATPTPGIIIDSTDNLDTSGPSDSASYLDNAESAEVAIGETVRIRLEIKLPESTSSSISITPNLPPGLVYLGNATIGFLSDNGIVTTINGAQLSGSDPDLANPVAAIERVNGKFSLGDLNNQDRDPNNTEYIIVEFDVFVDNIQSNTAGAKLELNYTLNSNGAPATSGNVTLTVVEPALTIDKSVTDVVYANSNPNTDNDAQVTYTVTITNNGKATAHDISLTDVLPSGATIVGSPSITGDLSNSGSGENLAYSISSLAPGQSITLTYTVSVADRTAPPPATDANVTWTSMPGTPGSTVERQGNAHDDAPLGKIEGTLWDDTASANGQKDAGEAGLAGVEVTLTLVTTGKTITLRTITDSDGKYNFGVLPKGTYTITVGNVTTAVLNGQDTDTLTVRWDTDGGTLGSIAGTLTEGQSLDAKNFGYIQVNDKPTIGTDGTTPTFIEGVNTATDPNVLGTAVKLPVVTIKDVELENGLDSYKDTSLTVARSDGANGFAKNAEDIFSLAGTGLTVAGSSITVDGNVVATFTNVGGELKITFTDKANMVIVNQIANAISYANSSQNPNSSVTLRYRFDDANDGNKQGTGSNLTGDATVTVEITKQNDPPETVGLLPNKTGVDGSAIANIPTAGGFKDVDGDTLKYSATGLPTGLTIDPVTGVISGTPDKNASQGGNSGNKGTYTVVVTATDRDRDGLSVTQTFEIKITNPAPTATADTHEVTAGSTVSSDVIQGNNNTGKDTDPDGDALTVTGVITGTETDISKITGNIGTSLTGTYGTLTLSADGIYKYVADQAAAAALPKGVKATDTFTYAISDGEGGVAYTTLTITVTGLNDAPVSVGSLPDQTGVDSSAITNIPTAGGFKDVDGDTLTYSATGLPSGLTIDSATGVISGTPDKNTSQGSASGTYTVVVTAKDPDGLTTTQTFEIKITNPAPIATADTNTVTAGDTVRSDVVQGSNNAGKDFDPDGDALTVTGVITGTETDISKITGNVGTSLTGTYGTLTLSANGTYDYVANQAAAVALPKGVTKTDTFTYAISDGEGGVAYTTLTITVTGLNDAPVSVGSLPNKTGEDSSAITNIPTAGGFKDVDGDTLTYSATGLPSGLTIDSATGVISGTPDKNASQGSASGTYTVVVTAKDPDGLTTTQTFEIKITNPAPIATADTNTVTAGDTVRSDVVQGGNNAGKDFDPDGDALTVTGVITGTETDISKITGNVGTSLTGTYGTLTLNANGTYDYVANQAAAVALPKGVTKTDTFTYAISDGEGGVAYTTLTITVTGLNDAPVSVGNLPNQTGVDSSAITDIPTAGGFKDVDSDTLEYSATGLPSGLTIDSATGVISGTPDKNASQGGSSGTYTVVVTAKDPDGLTTTQTFEIKITNPAPTARPDAQTIHGEKTATGNVLTGRGSSVPGDASDSDPDGDVLFIVGVSSGDQTSQGSLTGNVAQEIAGVHGKLTLQKDGSYTYERNNGTPGPFTDVFTYTISDGEGGFATTTLTININDSAPSVTDKGGNPPSLETDPADPNGPKRPVIKPDGPVSEGGLTTGSTPGQGTTTTGTIVLTPGDGSSTVIVTPPGGTPVELDSGVPTKVTTPQGEVTLTYTEGDPSNGIPPKVTYEYELKTPVDDTTKSPTDEFNVTVTDKDGDSTTVTVVVEITDDKPAATPDTTTVNNGSNTATGNALGNDTLGADRDTLVTGVISDQASGNTTTLNPDGSFTITGEHGTLTIKPDGSYTYERLTDTPLKADDVFTYTITDKDGDPASAKITIKINDTAPGISVPPTSGNTPGNPTVDESGLTDGSDPDSGSNKTTGSFVIESSDGEDPPVVSVTPPGGIPVNLVPGQSTTVTTPHGEVTVTYTPGNGTDKPTISYEYELKTPTDGSTGTPPTDSFTITVTDNDGDSSSTTVTVNIVDDVPDAKDDTTTTLVNVPVTGELGGNDTPGADGPVTWTTEQQPGHGTVTIDPVTGKYTYVPEPGFVGTDTFTYTITDKDGSTSTATVTITVTNQPPVAVDDSNTTKPGEPAKGNVITGGSAGDHADSDPDGQPVTVTEITVDGITVAVPPNDSIKVLIPNKGVLEIGSDGSYTFTPQPLWAGQVPDIHYTISDGFGGTSSAVLRITSTAAPLNVDPPARPGTGITTDVGTTVAPPLSGGSSTLLVLGDAMTDTPSVFWESYRYFQDMRVPTVMHPITYVNLEVQRAQLAAVQAMLDNWPALQETTLRAIALGLGQDPNLFVEHAVHAAQQERRYLEFVARELKANLPTETPVQAALNQLQGAQPKVESAPQEAPAAPSASAPESAEMPQALLDLLERWNTSEPVEKPTGMMAAVMAGKAASFSEQLKEQAHQLPGNVS